MSERDPVTPEEERLLFTVASVWREERVSCPHPDLLRAYLGGSLDGAAAEYLGFHLGESQCPYCNALVDEMRAADEQAERERLDGLRDKLRRSTVAALRHQSGDKAG